MRIRTTLILGLLPLILTSILCSCGTRVREEPGFVNVDRLLIVPHPSAGIVGLRRSVRAYVDTTESEGTAPSMVVDLPEELGIRGFCISPDGQQLVYSVGIPLDAEDMEPPPGFVLLRSCNLMGVAIGQGGNTRFTMGSYKDVDPFFDVDNEHVLFASNRRRHKRCDLLRIHRGSKRGIQDIYVDVRGQFVLTPSMAKDNTIALCLYPGEGSQEPAQVWTVGGPRGYPTQICSGTQPQISPDGRRLVYIGSDSNVWVSNTDGTSASQLTTEAADITRAFQGSLSSSEQKAWHADLIHPFSSPSWTRDGRYLVFSSMQGRDSTGRPNQDIWSMTADGTNRRQLTTNGSLDTYPVASPDGQHIYFVSNRGGKWAIWRMQAPDSLQAIQ